MGDRIRRRRALRDAETMEMTYIATAAAFGGREAFRVFRQTVADLRKDGGFRRERNPAAIAKQLGLSRRG